jgi:hypothetical protein
MKCTNAGRPNIYKTGEAPYPVRITEFWKSYESTDWAQKGKPEEKISMLQKMLECKDNHGRSPELAGL